MELKEFSEFTKSLSAYGSKLLLNTPASSVSNWAKPDGTIVTELDFMLEEKFREEISRKYPTHSIIGEELPPLEKKSDYCWILDPIDGTFNFSLGIPFYGILIGLLLNGKPTFGSCRLPSYGNAFIAGDNKHCYLDDKVTKKSDTCNIDNALILTSDETRLLSSSYVNSWLELRKTGSTFRTWGDCFGYYLLLSGKADVMIDIGLKGCDILPLLPILRGAGLSVLTLNPLNYSDIVVCVPKLTKKLSRIF